MSQTNRKEYNALYYIKNKEKIDKKNKAYAIKHKDKIKKQNAERYLKNKETVVKRSKDRYEKNEELIKRQSKERYIKNRIVDHIPMLLRGARTRAKKHNLPFDLEKSDIIIPSHCPILGIVLFRDKGRNNPNSPSIDRIDNSRGYVKNNIHIISNRANSIKRDADLDELVKFGKWAKTKLRSMMLKTKDL